MALLRVLVAIIALASATPPNAGESNADIPIVTFSKTPRASFKAFVPNSSIPLLLTQLERYSAAQGFTLHSRQTRPGPHFLVDLDSSVAQIDVTNPFDPVDPAEFSVFVYDPDGGKLQASEVAAIIERLRDTLCGIERVKCLPTKVDGH